MEKMLRISEILALFLAQAVSPAAAASWALRQINENLNILIMEGNFNVGHAIIAYMYMYISQFSNAAGLPQKHN